MDGHSRWVRASDIDAVPEDGSGHGFRIDGLDIAIFRWDQRFFALENFCPHLGFPLTEGIVQEATVICGWHGWRVRLEDGGCRGKALTARTFPCEVRDNGIWVRVPETLRAGQPGQPPSFRDGSG